MSPRALLAAAVAALAGGLIVLGATLISDAGEDGRPDAPPPMRLYFQDDATLLYPRDDEGGALGEPTPEAERRVARIVGRMRAAGFSGVRLTAIWGRHELGDGTFDHERLAEVVGRLAADGLEVHVTLTGVAEEWECQPEFSPSGRACADRPTGLDPDPREFARFAAATARALRGHVRSYGIWNEPNLRAFLRGSRGDEADRVVPAALYGRLLEEGTDAVRSADPDAKVWAGELSEAVRLGRRTPGGALERVDGLDFLRTALRGREVWADGVAWHPYQHREPPARRARELGIGRLDEVAAAIPGIEGLSRPGGGSPGLHVTEFGYLARPLEDGHADGEPYWHGESERARRAPEALDLAVAAGARTFVWYHAVEHLPPGAFGWDSGVLGPDGEVSGSRTTGDDGRGEPRQAWCAIWLWADRNGYPTDDADCS